MKNLDFKKIVFETIKKFNMLDKNDNIIIGVSGGIDSMSLLHFLKNNTGNKITSVHINHMLRGSESDRDEKFVKQKCKDYKVDFVSKKIDVYSFSKKNKLGIEESAREVRYKFFQEVAKKYNAKIVTAHTLSDSIETIIFNFTRGAGLSGLCGIPPVRGDIVRPFINVSRSEIEKYAKKYSIDYVNDSSNFSNSYSRNRIRHFIIPELKKINESFENNARKCISNLFDENKFISELSELELKNSSLNCNKIISLSIPIRNRVLKMILTNFHFNVEFRHIVLANMLIERKINSFNVDDSRIVKIKDDKIVCESRKSKQLTNNKKEFIVLSLEGENRYYTEKCNMMFDIKGDLSNFEFRTRMPGDSFSLQKRKCSKSLRKLFNELKIPVNLRDNLKILFDKKNNEVVWVESVGVSEKYVVSDKSEKIGLILEK